MFRKNRKHQQPALISAASELPEKQRKRLENSWAGVFYQEFFRRIDEETFAVLYSDVPSRPNVPVNVLIGLEAMKSGFGWSDQELYENYCYNLQVRYALGYDRLGDGDFEIRTLYYFRERLSHYNAEQGVNLLEKAFEQITDKQIVELKVRTGMQRMDSTQIASNIMDASRLNLVVEGIRRLQRIASEEERAQLGEWFGPYLKERALQYAYRVKGKEATLEHIQQVGQALWVVLQAMQTTHASDPVYQVVQRLFEENYHRREQGICAKENRELTSDSLQSLDDQEATFRTKGTAAYKGYVANITETCDPQNDLQLITKVQVDANCAEDSQLLNEALPNLKQRTDVDTLITDGGYPSDKNDEDAHQLGIRLIQTGFRGIKPDPDRFNLADFQITQDDSGLPVQATCPNAQTAQVTHANTSGYFARFPADVCATCPFQLDQRCRARPQARDPRYYIDFTLQEMRVAQRRRDYLAHLNNKRNLRAAVEATVRSTKHPFPAGKLPVRGRFRMTCMVIASAMVVNVRRIWRFTAEKIKNSAENTAQESPFFFSKVLNLAFRNHSTAVTPEF